MSAAESPSAPPATPHVGERLRRLRRQQELTLQEVELRSGGQLRASVIGAYERGERNVSLARLQQLADFFKVPVAELMPAAAPSPGAVRPAVTGKVVVDLAALEQVRDRELALANYVSSIQARRGDYNGQVITMRAADLDTLAAASGEAADEFRQRLTTAGIVR